MQSDIWVRDGGKDYDLKSSSGTRQQRARVPYSIRVRAGECCVRTLTCAQVSQGRAWRGRSWNCPALELVLGCEAVDYGAH